VNAGDRIAGRYALGERLGLGGMSTVHAAFDERLERDVAIKLLAEHLADDAQFVARFRREALAAARLVHPNIVQVFDFGLDDATGRHYIVMERIFGPSGAQRLREGERLSVPEAVDWIVQACRGLQYAHRNGVVHRDVKPGNLLRSDGDETVKLADFGIAKAASDESSITQVGSILGTAAYLAPEQAAGEDAGPAADVYGLGVVAYQMLSGRLPYEAMSLTELALMQQRERPPRLNHLDPAIPAGLANAVARALELDPGRRHRSADAFREAVLEGVRGGGVQEDDPTAATTVLGGDPTTGPMVVPRAPRAPRVPPPAAPVAAPARPAAAAPRRRRRRRLARLVAALVILALVAGGAAVVVAASNDKASVQLRRVVYDDANQVIDQLTQLIHDNTR